MGFFGGGGGGIGGGAGRVGGGGFRPGGMFSGGGAPMMGGSPVGGMFGGGMGGGGMMPGMAVARPQIAQPGVLPQQTQRPQIAVPQRQNLPKAGQAVAPPVAPPPTPSQAPTPMIPSKGPTLNPPQPGRGFPTSAQQPSPPPQIAQPGAQPVGQLPPSTQGRPQMGKDQSRLTPPIAQPQMTQRHGLGGRFGEGMYPGNGPSTVMQPQVAPFQPGKTGMRPPPAQPGPARSPGLQQQATMVPPLPARNPGLQQQAAMPPLPTRSPGPQQQAPMPPIPARNPGLQQQAAMPPRPTARPSVAPQMAGAAALPGALPQQALPGVRPLAGPGAAQMARGPGSVSPMTQQAAAIQPVTAGISPGAFSALKEATPGTSMPSPPTRSPGAPEAVSPKKVSYSFGKGTVRNKPVKGGLESSLGEVAHSYGVEAVIHSGGQAGRGSGGRRVKGSSIRHDHGGAADLKFRKPDGTFLSMNNPADREVMGNIVTDMTRRGWSGVGAGNSYMGPHTMHIGGGTPGAWGAGGKSVNAPAWLNAAHARGLR